METWFVKKIADWNDVAKEHLKLLFTLYLDRIIGLIRHNLKEPIATMDIS